MKTFAAAGGFAGPVSLPAMRILAAAILVTALGAIGGNAAAETVAEIASPNGALAVAVMLDPDGRPGYAISRRGAAVIAESRLGFILADAPKLERGFRLAGKRTAERGRNLGTALGRAAVRARPLQRASRPPGREGAARAPPGRRLPRPRRRHRLPLRISGTGGAHRRRDRRRADRIRRRGTGDGLVDPGRRLEPLRIPLPEDAARRGRPGPHADDHPDRERAAYRLPRGGTRRLLGHVASAKRRRAKAQGDALALGRWPARAAQGAVLDALAHAADRGQRGRPLHVRPHPQPE